MATLDITEDKFEALIEDNGIVIIDFWAEWCGPCKAFGPIYEEVSEQEKFKDIVFGKVNTEVEQGLAGAFQVRSIPTLMIFREQIVLFQQPGMLNAEQLEEVIGKVKGLDMDEIRAEIEKEQAKNAN